MLNTLKEGAYGELFTYARTQRHNGARNERDLGDEMVFRVALCVSCGVCMRGKKGIDFIFLHTSCNKMLHFFYDFVYLFIY